ncbi:hypothetical protein CU102_06160 [Phyllobacterium brassicacearum]|uniref:DUF1127 domain-containing protein n=1 Tax=Phyllobacterium brassicacearum TaxID=314235 RepID=A0A2P7BTU4_9HYPH|nr:hypothetical protein [Phyllobacterium brassicacearum]PSH69841.1 hypothetical protein CU102_06160 [Phyllobacterium brassicacearum]TDQ35005.1 hypothetical protein DEV91_102204 [Phyllobacterium brassicacearum]
MSTCDELYQRPQSSITERISTVFVDRTNRVVQAIAHAREVFVRERRLRETEMALDGLPEDIRCDIGWPDLYERQITECNKLKSRH